MSKSKLEHSKQNLEAASEVTQPVLPIDSTNPTVSSSAGLLIRILRAHYPKPEIVLDPTTTLFDLWSSYRQNMHHHSLTFTQKGQFIEIHPGLDALFKNLKKQSYECQKGIKKIVDDWMRCVNDDPNALQVEYQIQNEGHAPEIINASLIEILNLVCQALLEEETCASKTSEDSSCLWGSLFAYLSTLSSFSQSISTISCELLLLLDGVWHSYDFVLDVSDFVERHAGAFLQSEINKSYDDDAQFQLMRDWFLGCRQNILSMMISKMPELTGYVLTQAEQKHLIGVAECINQLPKLWEKPMFELPVSNPLVHTLQTLWYLKPEVEDDCVEVISARYDAIQALKIRLPTYQTFDAAKIPVNQLHQILSYFDRWFKVFNFFGKEAVGIEKRGWRLKQKIASELTACFTLWLHGQIVTDDPLHDIERNLSLSEKLKLVNGVNESQVVLMRAWFYSYEQSVDSPKTMTSLKQLGSDGVFDLTPHYIEASISDDEMDECLLIHAVFHAAYYPALSWHPDFCKQFSGKMHAFLSPYPALLGFAEFIKLKCCLYEIHNAAEGVDKKALIAQVIQDVESTFSFDEVLDKKFYVSIYKLFFIDNIMCDHFSEIMAMATEMIGRDGRDKSQAAVARKSAYFFKLLRAWEPSESIHFLKTKGGGWLREVITGPEVVLYLLFYLPKEKCQAELFRIFWHVVKPLCGNQRCNLYLFDNAIFEYLYGISPDAAIVPIVQNFSARDVLVRCAALCRDAGDYADISEMLFALLKFRRVFESDKVKNPIFDDTLNPDIHVVSLRLNILSLYQAELANNLKRLSEQINNVRQFSDTPGSGFFGSSGRLPNSSSGGALFVSQVSPTAK